MRWHLSSKTGRFFLNFQDMQWSKTERTSRNSLSSIHLHAKRKAENIQGFGRKLSGIQRQLKEEQDELHPRRLRLPVDPAVEGSHLTKSRKIPHRILQKIFILLCSQVIAP